MDNGSTEVKMEALAARKIFSYLDDAHGIRMDEVYVAKQLASTNDWLLSAIQRGKSYRVCTTELQTAGRGTKDRVWCASESSANIYLSFSYPLGDSLDRQVAGLTLVLGIAAVGALRSFGVKSPVFLKWPNDLYMSSGKLGGILVETVSFNGLRHAIIGVGINLVPPVNCHSRTANLRECMAWIELVERNRLVGYLLDQMLAACGQYRDYGFAPWRDTWNSLDYTAMKTIRVSTVNGEIVGRGLGVDAEGRLLIGLNDHQITSLVAGEITLQDIV